jgi:hypothetical protein
VASYIDSIYGQKDLETAFQQIFAHLAATSGCIIHASAAQV